MSDEPRHPYVIFETRAVEDRTASIETGHYVAKDVDYAIITPTGSRDRIEKVVEDWLDGLDEGVRNERLPATWPGLYREAYKRWKAGHDLPEHGTPVRNWPSASPAQVRTLLDMGINSVEACADMNEEAVMRLGMGGRALKQQAQAWLQSSNDTGKTAADLDDLRRKNEALTTRAELAEEANKNLAKRLEALEAKSKEKA